MVCSLSSLILAKAAKDMNLAARYEKAEGHGREISNKQDRYSKSHRAGVII